MFRLLQGALGAALLCASLSTQGPTIDFESFPSGSFPPHGDGAPVRDQFDRAPWHVRFRMLDSSGRVLPNLPMLAKVGPPRTAFAGPSRTTACSPISSNDDTPSASSTAGCYFLTDGFAASAGGATLEIELRRPCRRIALSLLDVDDNDAWSVTTLDASRSPIACGGESVAPGHVNGTGNGTETPVFFDLNEDVRYVLVRFTGSGTAVGMALDNLRVCRDGCPPVVTGVRPAPELGPAALGVRAVAQLFAVPAGAGRWYLTSTVSRANGMGWDVLAGYWDGSRFTPTTDVDGLNSSGDEFQCSVSRDLLHVVLDTPNGPVVASRATPTGPFGSPLPLTGVPKRYVDPQLVQIDGRLALLFMDGGGGIDRGWLDPATGAVTGVTDVVDRQRQAGVRYLHSPTPIPSADGECRHFVFAAANTTGGSDAWYQSCLEPGITQPVPLWDDCRDWLANPWAVGGATYWADAPSGYSDPLRIGMFASPSVFVPVGVPATARFVAHCDSADPVVWGAFVLGLDMPRTRMTGIDGTLCVTPIVSIPAMVSGCELATSLPLPPVPQPASIGGQAVGMTAQNRILLGNRFRLVVR